MLSFRKILKEDLEQILNWRTLPEVTRYMFTDIDNNIASQQIWYEKIIRDISQKHWVIVYEGRNIGVINLADIDYESKHCSWGYFIGDTNKRGIGYFIPPYLYNYVFKEMKFKKIIAEVLEDNSNVMRMYELHGYIFVGKFKKHKKKNNRYYDKYVYELHSKNWLSMSRYKKFITPFEE